MTTTVALIPAGCSAFLSFIRFLWLLRLKRNRNRHHGSRRARPNDMNFRIAKEPRDLTGTATEFKWYPPKESN